LLFLNFEKINETLTANFLSTAEISIGSIYGVHFQNLAGRPVIWSYATGPYSWGLSRS